MTESGSEVSFFDTADVIWDEAVIDVRDLLSFNALYEKCLGAIDGKRREGKGVLLDIKIEGLNSGLSDVIEKIENGELLELLQESEKEEDSFVWVHRLKFTEDIALDRAGLIKQSDFYEELFSTIEQYDDLGNSLSPLFQHSQARRHLGMLSEREKEELVEDAERILLQMLLKN